MDNYIMATIRPVRNYLTMPPRIPILSMGNKCVLTFMKKVPTKNLVEVHCEFLKSVLLISQLFHFMNELLL